MACTHKRVRYTSPTTGRTRLAPCDACHAAYSQRPEVKAYQKAYSQRPEVRARQKAYSQRRAAEVASLRAEVAALRKLAQQPAADADGGAPGRTGAPA